MNNEYYSSLVIDSVGSQVMKSYKIQLRFHNK